MTNRQTPKRRYRRVTKETVAKHMATKIALGNASAAVRELEPDYKRPDSRVRSIEAKSGDISTLDYIESSLQQIGVTAIERLNELVQSPDEKVAGVNTRYAIDHLRGKAVQKSVNLTAKVNIQSVLD